MHRLHRRPAQQPGGVDDHLHPVEMLCPAACIRRAGEVDRDEARRRERCVEAGDIAHHRDHRMPVRQQFGENVTADETARADEQYPHPLRSLRHRL